MNRKLEMAWWVFVGIAAVAIVAFLICGCKGYMDAAAVSVVIAGIAASVALAAMGLKALRERNGSFE